MEEQLKEYLQQLETIAASLEAKSVKNYKIDSLKKIAEESYRLSADCGTCARVFQETGSLIQLLKDVIENPAPLMKTYLAKVQELQKHFHKEHGFIAEGYYMALFMPIGLCFGVAFSSIIDNFAFIAVGLPIGVAIGAAMDEDARKKGKVI